MKHNWTYKKLGEVATLTGGFTPKADELFSEGKYPYFKVSDMNTAGNEVVLTKTPSFVVDSKKCYPKGSIVFPKNGAAVSTNKKRILGQDSIVDLNTCAAILNSDIDIKFAYYWFYNLDFKTLVRGGALPTLDLKGLRSLQFPIPSLDEQQAIVRELDGINHLIDLQEEQLREYDRLAQSLFYSTFGDPITNPKGWEVKSLGEVGRVITGNTPSTRDANNYASSDVCFFKPSDFDANQLSQLCESEFKISNYAYEQSRKLPKGAILTTCIGIVGKVGILKTDATCNQQINAIIPNELTESYYLGYAILLIKNLLSEKANAPVVPLLNKSQFSAVCIPLPPLALQQTFAAQIEAIEQQKALIRRSLDETRTLLAARMQYYFE